MIRGEHLPDLRPGVRVWYRLPAGRKMRNGDAYEVAGVTPRRDGTAVYIDLRYVDDGYVPPVLRAT